MQVVLLLDGQLELDFFGGHDRPAHGPLVAGRWRGGRREQSRDRTKMPACGDQQRGRKVLLTIQWPASRRSDLTASCICRLAPLRAR